MPRLTGQFDDGLVQTILWNLNQRMILWCGSCNKHGHIFFQDVVCLRDIVFYSAMLQENKVVFLVDTNTIFIYI